MAAITVVASIELDNGSDISVENNDEDYIVMRTDGYMSEMTHDDVKNLVTVLQGYLNGSMVPNPDKPPVQIQLPHYPPGVRGGTFTAATTTSKDFNADQ